MKLSDNQKKFLAYYNALPRTKIGIPSREDLNIQDIPELLGQITVLKILGPRKAVITLSGSVSEQLLNTAMTGFNIYDFLAEREQVLNEYLLRQVTDHPCAGSSTMVGAVQNSKVTETHNLSVPFLARDEEAVSIVIYQQFNSVPEDNFSRINKSPDALHLSYVKDIHTYDIGFGTPEDDGTIAHYKQLIEMS